MNYIVFRLMYRNPETVLYFSRYDPSNPGLLRHEGWGWGVVVIVAPFQKVSVLKKDFLFTGELSLNEVWKCHLLLKFALG